MASLVPLLPFIPASESWDSYLARFDCYLQANELTEVSQERKRGLFLSLCGPEVFETARALVAPVEVQAAPWDMIKEKLCNHYAPQASVFECHLVRARSSDSHYCGWHPRNVPHKVPGKDLVSWNK
ncbi:Hypothetical predicted protein [Podarcis lilfordi]|uniref:Uncharacterized protein n=1 Tax=Podarcis lilfordi TaxID=74358 RepID=A0AA35LDF5_9SAUR|nr:Hypothetical predicted protein [Podarcis lilfordi]